MSGLNNMTAIGVIFLSTLFGTVESNAQENAPLEAALKKAESAPPDNQNEADEYYDLGGFHQKVTTESPVAQQWFDRGLAMCYAFNHGEAVRCFEKALQADSAMPMALWGMAYAMGPNMEKSKGSATVLVLVNRRFQNILKLFLLGARMLDFLRHGSGVQ